MRHIEVSRLFAGAEPSSAMLAKIALILSLVSLSLGGIAATIVGLTRSTLAILVDPLDYYRWLTIHGLNMLILWLPLFEVTALYTIMSIFIRSRPASPIIAWIGHLLIITGWFLLNWSVFTAPPALYTAYTPLATSPSFYIGYELLSIGILIAGSIYIATLIKSESKNSIIPWAGGVAAVIAIVTALNGIAAFLLPLSQLLGLVSNSNPLYYHWIFWGFGHDAQYINASATVLAWYLLLALGSGLALLKFVSSPLAKLGLILLMIFVTPGIGHHILVDPMYSIIFKNASGNIGSHFLATGSMVSAFSILSALETMIRSTRRVEALLGWIRAIPWRNPGFAGAIFSMILFAIGGVSSINMTSMPTNVNLHNTMWIPGHIHFIVAGGTSLAFMALSYYIVPALFNKRLYSVKLAIAQIYLSFIGISIQGSSMLILGWEGAPRRTYLFPDIMLHQWIYPSIVLGIGAIIFITSGVLYFINILLTILRRSTFNIGEGLIEDLDLDNGDNRYFNKKGSLAIITIIFIASLAIFIINLLRLLLSPASIR